MSELTDFFGEPIHVYTRAQAIADGVLVDVTTLAKEAGFVWPVALTAAAHEDCVRWTGDTMQDETGRLWDVLFVGAWAIKAAKEGGSRLAYEIHRVPNNGNRWATAKPVELVLVVGPGDTPEPVITIKLASEG